MGMLTSPVPCRRLSGNGGFIVDVRAIYHEVVHDINLPYTLQKSFGSASIWVIDIFLHVLAWLINLSDNQHIN